MDRPVHPPGSLALRLELLLRRAGISVPDDGSVIDVDASTLSASVLLAFSECPFGFRLVNSRPMEPPQPLSQLPSSRDAATAATLFQLHQAPMVGRPALVSSLPRPAALWAPRHAQPLMHGVPAMPAPPYLVRPPTAGARLGQPPPPPPPPPRAASASPVDPASDSGDAARGSSASPPGVAPQLVGAMVTIGSGASAITVQALFYPPQRRPNPPVSGPPYKCEHPGCRSVFKRRYDHSVHQRVHTNERPFHCPLCSQTFKTCGACTAHIRTHTGERPYACPHPGCSATFSHRSSCNRHYSLRHGDQKSKPPAKKRRK